MPRKFDPSKPKPFYVKTNRAVDSFAQTFEQQTMSKKILTVQALTIAIEQIKDTDYISLTDIAKQSSDEPRFVIQNWLKNIATINYLWEWESLHNPDLNRVQLHTVLETTASNRLVMSPKKWIEMTGAVGLVSTPGRTGGTLAHKDIALNFCYWLSPKFQIYLIKEFQRLKEAEFSAKNLEWHVERITNLVDETRNWLDTIPGQKPDRDRLKKGDAPEI